MNKIQYPPTNGSKYEPGDLYINPRDKDSIYILACYDDQYIAVNISTGITWCGARLSAGDALYGLEFYKRDATINVE